uniref:ThuA domain-containing protein n=1 Tax=Roseihalotalea indica TaxID=2867963 RepID=A0AA49GRT0_9BACT|nr:ThuA domain-containing protein [Tunicatimonas sp. TK19036]
MRKNFQFITQIRLGFAAGLLGCLAVSAVILFSGFRTSGETTAKSIRTLIVGGGSSHDFDQWYKQADAETLEKKGFATVTYTDHTDSIAAYLPETDVLYLANNQPISDPEVRQAIFDFVESGKGLVLGHAALWYNWADWPDYNQQLVSGGSRSHDKYGNFNVAIVEKHPVTKGVKSFSLDDELYHYELDAAGPGIEVLAEASMADSDQSYPSIFVVKHPKGRIVGFALGHDAASHDLPQYQQLLRNAIQWAGK